MKKKGDITSYPIMIKRDLWEAWKKTIPRDINLNEALVKLVERDLEEKGKAKGGKRENERKGR